ncbi:MAG TPA: mannose-1-phosphate guanylyltransferase/mannose-6-phosphate isomerase [Acidimicrobiia bacterium]|jgi:mannose-1-phosphate guanylyltransferase/mannose-6-phosphate isomerase
MLITPVVLSGGSGTRLWPLSRASIPKQFVALTGERTLFQQTVLRAKGIEGVTDPIVVGNRDHIAIIASQLAEVGVTARAVIVEPEGRNTAPAVALAAEALDSSDLMLVMPSDSLILDESEFRSAVRAAIEPAMEGSLVTFGVTPTRPETGYGYIEVGGSRGSWSRVARFVEKPDGPTAEAYVAGGRHLWNAGMFLFAVGDLRKEMSEYAPSVGEAVATAWAARRVVDFVVEPDASFASSPSISIDHAVMERSDRVAVVPMDAGWSDVGSWQALWELGASGDSNVTIGPTALLDVSGSYVRADGRLVALIGVEDLVVVDTPDALLISSRERSQDVKLLLESIPPELK